jgi:cytochrome c oxidase subunit I+III
VTRGRPAAYAFASLPEVDRRADTIEPRRLARDLAAGSGYLAFTRNGWQETLGVHVTSGRIDQLIVLPRATYLPLGTAIAVAVVVLAMLLKVYLVAACGFLVVMGLFVLSGQSAGLPRDFGPLDVGRGVTAPPHTEVEASPPWLAMIFTLAADGTIFISLLFGGLYLWLVAPNWPPAEIPRVAPGATGLAVAALALGPVAARAARAALSRGGLPGPWLALGGLGALGTLGLLWLIGSGLPSPTGHAAAATGAVLLGYVGLHVFVGGLFFLSNLLRLRAGYLSPRRTLDLRLSRAWQDYTALTGVVALAFVLLLPALASLSEARP